MMTLMDRTMRTALTAAIVMAALGALSFALQLQRSGR